MVKEVPCKLWGTKMPRVLNKRKEVLDFKAEIPTKILNYWR